MSRIATDRGPAPELEAGRARAHGDIACGRRQPGSVAPSRAAQSYSAATLGLRAASPLAPGAEVAVRTSYVAGIDFTGGWLRPIRHRAGATGRPATCPEPRTSPTSPPRWPARTRVRRFFPAKLSDQSSSPVAVCVRQAGPRFEPWPGLPFGAYALQLGPCPPSCQNRHPRVIRDRPHFPSECPNGQFSQRSPS
jgi:hypothetical protein